MDDLFIIIIIIITIIIVTIIISQFMVSSNLQPLLKVPSLRRHL